MINCHRRHCRSFNHRSFNYWSFNYRSFKRWSRNRRDRLLDCFGHGSYCWRRGRGRLW